MIDLDGKVAIIPGGATLIGRKVAHEFLRAGARVTVCDIDEAGGRELEQEAGDGLKFIHADISDDAQIDAVIKQTVDAWGGIDCLVNVACTYLDNGLDSTRAEWRGGTGCKPGQRRHFRAESGALYARERWRRGRELCQHKRQTGATGTLALCRVQGGDHRGHAQRGAVAGAG